MITHRIGLFLWLWLLLTLVTAYPAAAPAQGDADQDGLPDSLDACPVVAYHPGFDWSDCAPMDENPNNDPEPQCKWRERIGQTLLYSGVFMAHIAFAVVIDDTLHFADAFSYIGGGQYVHDPDGVNRLYRVGSTTKPIIATAAKVLEEGGELSLGDCVSDDDATQMLVDGERTLRQLLSHDGAFKRDSGALHLFCYPGNLASFWAEADDLVSPHYDSETYGNLGGGYEYSAFNYSLAGAYMANRTGETFSEIIQTRVFDPAGMCTATLDGTRAVGTPIGNGGAVSQSPSMHLGPTINQVSPTDVLCEDNFYSSEDLPGDEYTWQNYFLDEASAKPRDPAGSVIASVIDMAHFAEALLRSYHEPGGLLSESAVRDLWGATADLGCSPGCPYEPYYGIGFFTSSQPGQPVTQVGHGGSRAGYASGFVLRPEAHMAVCVLANADASTVDLSDLAKTILDDTEALAGEAAFDGGLTPKPVILSIDPNPVVTNQTTMIRFSVPRAATVRLQAFNVRGQVVGTLADGVYSEGKHSVLWRPADDVPTPGVYFVRFSSLGTTNLQKVVIYQ